MAEQWGRRWITIDTSRVALALARQRLMGARFPYYLKADSPEGRAKEQEIAGKPLPPAQTGGDIRQGFVYERVQHITLKSIANNPDIVEGMSREQIDAAIKRHADFEVLYDRPYEDKSKVRVAGRFTVESLSPHRSLTFDQRDAEATRSRSANRPARRTRSGRTSSSRSGQPGQGRHPERQAQRAHHFRDARRLPRPVPASGRRTLRRRRGVSSAEPGRHRDRSAVRHRESGVHQGGRT